ncbi:acireductone dioxygenase [Sorangium cellulosum]|uniref:Acireductone dioxygenase n=1 Tax=Sorangium cellulosum TaxID=56 RepID=A0A2L0EMX6_SORCE|nr:cupin domain-containing protein [Sorangium cellulosum]AUX40646.1 acireductone dioxygenase [Sorangium cellulosum]
MSVLRVYRDNDPTKAEEYTTLEDIARVAAGAKIRFERWSAERPLAAGTPAAEVLEVYAGPVKQLSEACGFVTADVISVSPSTPNHPEIRRKFLDEHVHSEDEARFFVEGRGLFCIHHGERVLSFLVEKGDLISVPAGTRHWFDMGPTPSFTCIRWFSDPKGWVAEHTGSDIASRFPRLEA